MNRKALDEMNRKALAGLIVVVILVAATVLSWLVAGGVIHMPGPVRNLPDATARVLFTTFFDDGIQEVFLSNSGGVGSGARDATIADVGSGSLKITTSATVSSFELAGRDVVGLFADRNGIECAFRPSADVTTVFIALLQYNGDGSFDQVQVNATYTGTTTTLKYIDSAGVGQIFATLNYNLFQTTLNINGFYPMKLVGNFSITGSPSYEYFFLNGVNYTSGLTGIAGRHLTGQPNYTLLNAQCGLRNDVAVAKTGNFGRLTITTSEPQNP